MSTVPDSFPARCSERLLRVEVEAEAGASVRRWRKEGEHRRRGWDIPPRERCCLRRPSSSRNARNPPPPPLEIGRETSATRLHLRFPHFG